MKESGGVTWPGWEVLEPIGRGSFGTVYKIRRDVYGDIEEAALKVMTIPHSEDELDYLRSEGLDHDSITRTFHRQVGEIAKEYNLMKQMRDNPNIVRCDDFRDIQHDDGLGWDIYIKMELLTPLMKALHLVQTEQQIIRFGMDMCNGLAACQERNIIHRDIKPQNVFASPNGQFKLGDFGIARTMERTTVATAGIGTYSYMAPEVFRGKTYNKTADIYSLGLMMYWLLNERRGPFLPLPPRMPTAQERDEGQLRRLSGEAIPTPKNGSKELKAIVLKACAFRPEDRFQTAEEMLNALSELGQKKPAPQPQPEPEPKPAPQPQLNPVKEDETVVIKPVPAPVRKPEPEPDDETVMEKFVVKPEPKPERAPEVRPAADKKPKWASAPLSQVNPSSETEEEPKEKKKLDLLAVVVFGVFFYLVVFVPGSFFRAVVLLAAYVLFALYREWFRKRNPYTNIYAKINFWLPVICAPLVIIVICTLLSWCFSEDAADISAGYNTTAVLYDDGTVDMAGDYAFGVEYWENITQISVGYGKILGLCEDGTVVMRTNFNGSSNAFGWTDIQAVAAGSRESLGLRDDGSVVIYDHVYGMNIETGWSDVIAVAMGDEHAVALREDGTVVATGSNVYEQCDVSEWTDIVAISAGLQHTVGLKSDGTVIATGDNEYGQCDVEHWTDIVAVAAGGYHTVGLKSDGTVVAVGNDSFGQCDVSDWKNITAISAGGHHTVALKSNGALVAVGNNQHGECDVKELKKN